MFIIITKKDYNPIINRVKIQDFEELSKDFKDKSFNNEDSFIYRIETLINKKLFKESEKFIKKSIEIAPYIRFPKQAWCYLH